MFVLDDMLIGMAIAGAATSAVGSLARGAQGASNAEEQGRIAAGNTALLKTKAETEALGADLAYAKGTLEDSRTRDAIARALGGETAHYAASNLDPTSGSPLLLQAFSATQGQIDINLIHARAGIEAAAAHSRAAGTLAEAAGSAGQELSIKMKGDQDMLAGYFGAATSLLSAGSKMFGGGRGILPNNQPGGYGYVG